MNALKHFANRLKMVAAYFTGLESIKFYPQEIVIELTNHCNLACVMCPHSKMTRSKGVMDGTLYRKIIDEVAGKTELVYLYGTGESLIHRDLCSFTQYASSRGLYTVLSTNGVLMDEASARNLLGCNLDYLIIAFDGGVRETYERIRVKGDFDKVISNVKTLLRVQSELKTKTRICLQMIYMEENAHEIDLFRNLFSAEESRCVDQFRFKPLYKTRAYDQKVMGHNKPCYWLWNMMTVCWNGDVAICCTDYDAACILGNVVRDTVYDVWNSDRMQAFRRKHRKVQYQDMELCATCRIPEEGYFNPLTILGSAFFSARQVRALLPLYEKFFLVRADKDDSAEKTERMHD